MPRRPWLEPEQVQAQFLRLSANDHPDRVHSASTTEKALANERFAELNAACSCLRSTKDRLRHLLELERGEPLDPLERLPSGAMDFYFQVGEICRGTDRFLAERAKANSPLQKVQFFQQALDWVENIQQAQATLNLQRSKLEGQIKAFNPAWDAAPGIGSAERAKALPLPGLEQVYREFSYLARWSQQIQDRLVLLSL